MDELELKERIKELQRQDKWWDNMGKSGALDRGYVFDARAVIAKDLETAIKQERKLRVMRKKAEARQQQHGHGHGKGRG